MYKILNSLDISGVPEINDIFQEHNLVNVGEDRKKILSEIDNCEAYLASAAIRIDKEFLEKANKLKVIGSPHTGTDHMDLELIKQKGITCYDISKEFDLINSFTATSELAFTLLLSLIRKIVPASIDAKNGVWSREKYTGIQLFNKTFGIIGLGRLGEISARIARGFGMNVIAHDIKEKNIPYVKMLDLLSIAEESDFVSIHVHLNKETVNLIDKVFFKKMKKSALIVNTSRGKIINENDLLIALKENEIGGACLDVIDGEWLAPDALFQHPLIKYSRSYNNLILSPHIGGATKESIYGARVFMAKKIATFLNVI